MTCVKQSVLASVALALASWTQAAGLFLPVTPQGASGWVAVAGQGTTASSPVGEMSERRVRIARNELARARDDVEYSGAGRLLLNMRTDVDLDMVVERTAPTKWGYSLSGRIEGDAMGFVTLVVHEQAVAGTVWTPDAAYEVVHLGGSVHALRDVTNRPRPECAGAVRPALATSGETVRSGADDGSVVDILVVWTPAAEDEAGGVSQVKSWIELAIAHTNDALERSGALVSLNLVGAEKVDYEESDSPFLNNHRLSHPDDGHLDQVHALRDSLGADLVSLYVKGGAGGVGNVGGPFSTVGAWYGAYGAGATLAHEIGHNFGLVHDRSDYASGLPSYSFGFNAVNGRVCTKTIMSYGQDCVYSPTYPQPAPYYSSPWRYRPVDGQPLGVSRFSKERGPNGPADAVLGLNRKRHTIANFRPSRQTVSAGAGRAGHLDPKPTALGAVEAADSETPVEIPDAVLRKALEEALEKATDEPITRGDMASLSGLSVRRTGVQQLTGIEHAVNLQRLYVAYGAISDFAPLEGLTSLTDLDLFGNLSRSWQETDVSQLAGLTSLTELSLALCGITDVSPLAGLTSLTRLFLHANRITDVSPLAGLTSLTELYLQTNRRITDVSPLAGLTSLRDLRLDANGITDVSPLAGLTSLTGLSLDANGITDLAPLSGLRSLTRLVVGKNAVTDLAPLAGLTSLGDLRLDANGITDVSPLAGLTSLRILNLGFNGLSDVSPLAGLTSLRLLELRNNAIAEVGPLAGNHGLGRGDRLNLRFNPLSAKSLETDIPRLLQRGVDVWFDGAARDSAEVLAAFADPALADAFVTTLSVLRTGRYDLPVRGGGITLDDLGRLGFLDASSRGIEDLGGLELATGLKHLDLRRNSFADLAPLAGLSSLERLYLGGNDISDIGPLAGLDLEVLSLDDTAIEDFAPLADITGLRSLSLDGNSIRDLPVLPRELFHLYLTDNSISDIAALPSMRWPGELQLSGNSVASLVPLAGLSWSYLFLNDNRVNDLTPLNIESLVELHIRNNAVRDLSPLLGGDRLAMVDVRGNPLSGDALSVLGTLREAGVTVLAGEAVPYFPAAGTPGREGFVRIVNRSNADGDVFVEAVDDAGVRVGPVRIRVGARRTVPFNSGDLENGNAAKGLRAGVGRPTAGDWRLEVISPLDIEVLSYVRTDDGFVTAMHDVATQAMLPFFNPGSNENQRSILRVVNTEADRARWMTGGYDDSGEWHPMAGAIEVRPGHALRLTAKALEDDHGLGDGSGKWRLRARGFPWFAMSLLDSTAGPLANLSTAPNQPESLADGRSMRRVPLFLTAGEFGEGFLRVINRSAVRGEVAIEAVDDEGDRFGPVRLTIGARQTAHFTSGDLEAGNAEKGLSDGIGVGEGDWRLELASELDLLVLSYVRKDGFLTNTHDLAPLAADGSHRVVFFNPGRNINQVSRLRLINNGDEAASVTIAGIDDAGSDSGTVTLTVPAASASTFTSKELEKGEGPLAGGLGEGGGKWRLRVSSDVPLGVMSLLENRRTGHLANVSTGTED